MSSDPIDCDIYDHLEIACMRREPLRITLTSGECLEGEAVDVGTQRVDGAPAEYLVLTSAADPEREPKQIAFANMARIEAVRSSASFKQIVLQPPPAVLSI